LPLLELWASTDQDSAGVPEMFAKTKPKLTPFYHKGPVKLWYFCNTSKFTNLFESKD
jgi:hypothetical protein